MAWAFFAPELGNWMSGWEGLEMVKKNQNTSKPIVLLFLDYGLWFAVYGSRFMVVFYGYGLLLLNIKFEALEIFDSRRLIPRV